MPCFIVWSTGAVKTELIQRLEVPEPTEIVPYLVLSTGVSVSVPRSELSDVLKQLREAYAVSGAA